MLRPICYERVSTKNQLSEAGNGAGGLDDQRAAIDRYLDEKKHLFSEDRIYLQDRGISAFRNDNILPGSQLSQLLEGIRNKEYGEGYALVVLSLDRLSRRSSWAEDTIRYIVESGVEIHDISGRLVLNKNDANSKLYMEIVQSRSHNESLLKSTRAIAAWDRKIKEAIKDGKVISNRMPVWLVNDGGRYAVNEKKVEVIRSCFQMYANGMSTGEIVKHYKQKGEALQMVTVSNWVRDRRLLGEHERYNGQVYSGVYPVVIDSELFITANRMMDRVGLEKKKPREDLLLDPEVVKRIFRLYEDGLATGVIVKQLEAGWSTVNVLRVLRDKKVVQMKIIDNLTFERVNQKLSLAGVANRIRKDLSIAQDDFITNLFPKILKCGSCGGNIAIHYNHVRTKYVICRTREEKKACTAKSIQYVRIERNILETVKNVDFAQLMNTEESKDSPVDALREELSLLHAEEEEFNKLVEGRRSKGLVVGSAIITGLTEVQDKIIQVEGSLIALQEIREIPKLDFNIEDVLDPLNVELRAKVRKQLRLVLKSIKYRLVGNKIFVHLEYFNDYLTHVLVINNKRGGGDILTEFIIEQRDDVRRYNTDSFSLTYKEGDELPVFSTMENRAINFIEYMVLREYISSLEGDDSVVAGWMEHNEDFIFQS